MSKISKTTLILKDGPTYRRLAKVFFGPDGSYYSTVPRHSSRKAFLFKATVNYNAGTQQVIEYSNLLDAGLVEDNEIKLTHHPDGLVQFSGKGILSGKEKDGTIKGIGVLSSPLHRIFSGPSFVYAIQNIATLEKVEPLPKDAFILDLDEYSTIDGSESVTVEAHYFVPGWRRFIRYDIKSRPVIYVPHPAGAMVEFRVFESSLECKFPGFLGFEVYRKKLQLPEDGYSFGGPSGNMRTNEKEESIADGIFCVYPKQENMPAKRPLNYPQPGSA